MKGSILCLIAILALASGKPFFPVGYSPFFASPYSSFQTAPYASFQQAPFVQTVAAVPTFKFAGPEISAPAIKYVGSETFIPTQYAAVAPAVTPFLNKYHAQSKDGSYSFGYFGGPSSRQETRDKFGNVRGGFNYIDPYGQVQSQQYVADSSGFRVAATNLPVGPSAPTVATFDVPQPVEETEEVKQARAKFEKSFQEEKYRTRSKREADPDFYTATYTVPQTSFVAPAIPVPTFKSSTGKKYTEFTPEFKSSAPVTFPANTSPFVYSQIVPSQFPFSFYPQAPTFKSSTSVIPSDTPQFGFKSVYPAQPQFNYFPHAPTVYSAAPFPVPYSAGSAAPFPVPYSASKAAPFPFTYSAGSAVPFPITYSAGSAYNFKPATYSHITHSPGNTFSYRVDT